MAPRVLFVDDDRNLCQIVAKALRGEGYEVHTALDGDAALSALEESAPDFLLLDVLMPRKDGFAVCRAIRAHAAGKETATSAWNAWIASSWPSTPWGSDIAAVKYMVV